MSTSVQGKATINITGTIFTADADGTVISRNTLDLRAGTTTYSASTVPDGENMHVKEYQLTAGEVDIDLTALDIGSISGKKFRAFQIQAATTNTDSLLVVAHGTNGYNFMGVSGAAIPVVAGANIGVDLGAAGATVGGSAKVIKVTSSDVDALFNLIFISG